MDLKPAAIAGRARCVGLHAADRQRESNPPARPYSEARYRPDAVPSFAQHPIRRPLHRVLMCLLALIVMLQGAAVGVFIVLGPSHLHDSEAPTQVLVDFRRWKPSAPAPAPSAFLTVLAHGHGHGTLQTQRHYHAFDDSSVVRTGGDVLTAASDLDDLSASACLAAVLALLPEEVSWLPSHTHEALATSLLRAWLTVFTAPLERPPRRA